MGDDAVRIVISDPDTGEVFENRVIRDDYWLICVGDTYLAYAKAHANGTHILTVKRRPKEDDRG